MIFVPSITPRNSALLAEGISPTGTTFIAVNAPVEAKPFKRPASEADASIASVSCLHCSEETETHSSRSTGVSSALGGGDWAKMLTAKPRKIGKNVVRDVST
jgi:hypothetical protein